MRNNAVSLTLAEPLLTPRELEVCPLSERYEAQLRELCRSFHHRPDLRRALPVKFHDRPGDEPGKPVSRPKPRPKPTPVGV